MRTYLDCVPCFVRQTIDSVRRVTDDPAIHEQLLREVLAVAAELPFNQPPPVYYGGSLSATTGFLNGSTFGRLVQIGFR